MTNRHTRRRGTSRTRYTSKSYRAFLTRLTAKYPAGTLFAEELSRRSSRPGLMRLVLDPASNWEPPPSPATDGLRTEMKAYNRRVNYDQLVQFEQVQASSLTVQDICAHFTNTSRG